MPSDERDRQFERALQRHLRASSADAACPDAEILAAYHERTLSPEEVAQWKEHIVACSRCQETLALVEETSPVALHEWEEKGVAQRTVFLGESQDRTAKFEAVQEESAYPAMESAISGSAPLSAKKDVTP